MKELKYGVLASGDLGVICIEHILQTRTIHFVFTDKSSIGIIDFCQSKNIPFYAGNPRSKKALDFISTFKIDVLLSINYLFIVNKEIIEHPRLFAINFHGSLLPKYRGRTPHVWAIINNEKETGITAHLMSEECDEGAIVYQEKIVIPAFVTGADILKDFKERYPSVINTVLTLVDSDRINAVEQDHTKATYFGKRTSEDGEIDWNWQRERINNWVRAQAKPYPGAFTFHRGEKMIIHKIEYSDWGFHQDNLNGEILDIGDHLIVKTPNGAIKLVDFETETKMHFNKGEKLHGRH